MNEYFTIVIIALVQLGIYLWMDKRSNKLSKIWILVGFLVGQIFILPQLTILVYGLNDRQCGMPLIALLLFFVLFGGGLNLITHITYYFIKRNKIKSKL